MTSYSIEMIAASLRSCLLTSSSSSIQTPMPSQLVEDSDESPGVAVEQKSALQAGEKHCTKCTTGAKTTENPNQITTSCTTTNSSACESSRNGTNETNTVSSCSVVATTVECTEDESDDTADSSTLSIISSPSPKVTSADSGDCQILVLDGCTACYMYFMVPKCSFNCPKCGGCLLLFGRGG